MLIDLICLCFIIMGVILLILGNLNIRKNKNPIEKTKINSSNFAVLIPARDESLVIENLLKSLKNQTVKFSMQDVYVIVETKARTLNHFLFLLKTSSKFAVKDLNNK